MVRKTIRIAIADDHPIVIKGVSKLLQDREDMTLVAQYGDSKELLEGLQKDLPDILLLDIKMPGMGGEQVATILKEQYPGLGVIVLTYLDSVYYTKMMINNGVKGYLLKTSNDREILHAIGEVHAGRQYLEPNVQEKLLQFALGQKKADSGEVLLTKRQLEILKLIASNYSSQEIAKKLFLSKKTVENHRSNMLLKMEVKNAASLVKKAIELNLL